jgi:hypothetical protein
MEIDGGTIVVEIENEVSERPVIIDVVETLVRLHQIVIPRRCLGEIVVVPHYDRLSADEPGEHSLHEYLHDEESHQIPIHDMLEMLLYDVTMVLGVWHRSIAYPLPHRQSQEFYTGIVTEVPMELALIHIVFPAIFLLEQVYWVWRLEILV